MYEIKQRRVLSQILTCFIFYYFQNITISLKKATLQKKVIFEKELDCTDRDDIGNLDQRIHLGSCASMRNVGISQWPMIVKNVLEVLAKKMSDILQQPIDVHSVTNVVGESISSVTSGIFIGNQSGKHGFLVIFLLSSKYERQKMFF